MVDGPAPGSGRSSRPPGERIRTSDRSGQRGHPFPRHVWINVTGRPTDSHPGVLLDWRRADRGTWEALVTWVEGGGIQASHAHTAWLGADHVRPA